LGNFRTDQNFDKSATTANIIFGMCNIRVILRRNVIYLYSKTPHPDVRTTKYGLNSLRYCAPKQWNSLSDIERTAKNLNVFKTAIRKKTFSK
jgi:hypothetical protein